MKKTMTLVLLAILAVVLLGYGAVSLFGDSEPTVATDGSVYYGTEKQTSEETVSEFVEETLNGILNSTKPVASTSAQTQRVEDYEYAYAGFMPAYADMNKSEWNLILVNRDYILPDGYMPTLAPCITDDPDSLKLDYRVAPYYNEMYQAALEDGIELTPVSGYRSVERQTNNFENKIQKYINEGYSKTEATQMAATIILPPGTSEHNAGLAMDICSLYESFENTDEFEWLMENGADYGFILRYPEDKQDITKIIYEPWHWRYVGVKAAKEMKASGQCLEEYLGVA